MSQKYTKLMKRRFEGMASISRRDIMEQPALNSDNNNEKNSFNKCNNNNKLVALMLAMTNISR